jgi:hypothetical protein
VVLTDKSNPGADNLFHTIASLKKSEATAAGYKRLFPSNENIVAVMDDANLNN